MSLPSEGALISSCFSTPGTGLFFQQLLCWFFGFGVFFPKGGKRRRELQKQVSLGGPEI